MTKDEALKLALEALETNNKAWKHLADSGDAGFWEAEEQPFYELSVKAITAIKEALAQPEQEYKRGYADAMNWKVQNYLEHLPPKEPEQEPVAWVVYSSEENDIVWADKGERLKQNTPLYITPPQRTWVGLTDEEAMQIWDGIIKYAPSEIRIKDFAQAIEAKLKEKNT